MTMRRNPEKEECWHVCTHNTCAILEIITLAHILFPSPTQSLFTWRLDSYISTDEHIGLQQRLREGDHQGLKQTQGRCISLLHDLTINIFIWQSHALPQPVKTRDG